MDIFSLTIQYTHKIQIFKKKKGGEQRQILRKRESNKEREGG